MIISEMINNWFIYSLVNNLSPLCPCVKFIKPFITCSSKFRDHCSWLVNCNRKLDRDGYFWISTMYPGKARPSGKSFQQEHTVNSWALTKSNGKSRTWDLGQKQTAKSSSSPRGQLLGVVMAGHTRN
jgi:hypothetical protein